MRYLLAAALMFAACNDAPSRTDWDVRGIELRHAFERVAELEARLGVPASAPDLRPLVARIEALEKQIGDMKPARVPHLVGRAGQADERVIGIGAPGSACALSDSLGGTVCLSEFAGMMFDGPDCTGNAFVSDAAARPGLLHFDADGTVYAAGAVTAEARVASYRSGAKCNNQEPIRVSTRAATARDRLPVYSLRELSVELR